MRLRNVTGAIKHINSHPLVNQEPEKHKGKWNEFFGNDHPIHIEIGMGKGDFVIGNATKYPEINFIGIEKFSAVILRAVQKVESLETPLENLGLLRFDAVDIEDIFDENEIERVYLNFSDPWPKDRWAKRRLTYIDFLNKYKNIIRKDGLLRVKTDNDALFAFTLEELAQSVFTITKQTNNLHHSEFIEGNIMTEYEAKFVKNGENINFVEALNAK